MSADLADVARRIRAHVVRTAYAVGGAHLGGSLSAADILAVLYFQQMRIDPAHPAWPDRDRFVLSKGHCALALYAALAERGYFPAAELATYGALGTRLQSHPDMRKAPGLDMSTGSLGQGLSAAVGMAAASAVLGRPYHTYALIGDGEAEEGQIWEAAMFAGARRVGRLTAIMDLNGLSQTASTEPFHPPERLADRWRSFGWTVREIDGHNLAEIAAALAPAPDGPCVVIAHTVKGKGVSFMEGRSEFHSSALTADQLTRALAELGVSA